MNSWAELARLIRATERMADGTAKRALRGALADETEVLIGRGFAGSVSPTGKQWRPLKYPRASGRTTRVLVDSGRLHLDLLASVTYGLNGFTFSSKHPGSAVHQFGATIVPVRAPRLVFRTGLGLHTAAYVVIPARPYMPVGPRLPPAWKLRWNARAEETLRVVFYSAH